MPITFCLNSKYGISCSYELQSSLRLIPCLDLGHHCSRFPIPCSLFP
ncbi:MAG: hypothetical protein F6J94_17530 [Moorea sp. SIO1F2]|nr:MULTISPECIES: hypothetical protein [unclassified Moorena]NEN94767.1 hypothetical protein [Moorena sp. SIO3I7]NEO50961.1 hypothetical protein [Moorena sp. SIO4A3]NEO08597.1 hypothetical protein [Moorena sp. SIO3I8]NEO21174.1 hypothetical protein [Moorena sp. SIO4A5]NEP22586.1 hypothetical protein [Moorena sp. SIO3I6]